ncbi:MAG TPA: hypothetical protein VIL35_02035 [Vicinamibacterales bacterium]
MNPVPPANNPSAAPPPFETWTLIVWRVVRGRERAFLAAWGDLRAALDALERPPCWCLLLENQHEAGLFYAFGPWDDPAAVEAMRRDPAVQDAFQRLIDCCHEVDFGTYGKIRQPLTA